MAEKTLNRTSRAEPLFGLVEVDWRVPLRPIAEILIDAKKVQNHAKIMRFGPSMGIWVRQVAEDFEHTSGPHATFDEAWDAVKIFRSAPEPVTVRERERSKSPKWRTLPKYIRMTAGGKFQAFIYKNNRHVWSKNFKELGEALKAREAKMKELELPLETKTVPQGLPARLPRGIRLDGAKLVVKVSANGRRYYVGRFDSLEEAIAAQNKERKEILSECSDIRNST